MYWCASSIEVAFFYNFSIRFWYCFTRKFIIYEILMVFTITCIEGT